MYRFRQFCVRFSVLIEFFFGFSVQDDFFLRFAVSNRPQCPFLELVKLFGSSRNCSQLHMDYAVIHRKVSCQLFCFYYETVSWITINFAIIFLFAWFTSILTLEFIFFFSVRKTLSRYVGNERNCFITCFQEKIMGLFFFSWRFLGATQEGSVRVLLSDVLFCRATCYGALV